MNGSRCWHPLPVMRDSRSKILKHRRWQVVAHTVLLAEEAWSMRRRIERFCYLAPLNLFRMMTIARPQSETWTSFSKRKIPTGPGTMRSMGFAILWIIFTHALLWRRWGRFTRWPATNGVIMHLPKERSITWKTSLMKRVYRNPFPRLRAWRFTKGNFTIARNASI